MGDKPVIGRALGAAAVIAVGLSLAAAPADAQSLTDRFKGLFGGGSSEQKPASGAQPEATGESDLTCPPVTVRAGASTFKVGAPGKEAVGNDLRYQATITKIARECTINGGEITAKIGIQGRVIAGPAGAPPSVQVPVRVAVVQAGIGEKVIATKAYQTTVSMTEDASVPFVLVAEDLVYPAPQGAAADSYVFYVGFDPQSLKPEPKAKPKKK
ncbi:hypothetical protein [Bradyrhizobium sp.]|uniref:hypothetical protein n=1 Tax=Bradyrhizobium sp. TaxID=376 RepID=UPI001D684488|nr:hypothetical protein [Bradyrhizobium sp.]MBI5318499.1 hypothetical protein [Bradyrhizobium sp.]